MAQETDREPGVLALAIHGIKLVGVRGALRTVRYGRWKDRLDKRYLAARPTGPEVRPGPRGEPVVDGEVVRIPFGELSLELAFVGVAFVRLTWTPGSPPVAAALDDDEPQRLFPPSVVEDGDALVVGTPLVRVRLEADGSLTVEALPLRHTAGSMDDGSHLADWRVIRRERPPVRRGDAWTATVDLDPDDQVHGLGERAARFDLRPGTYGLWNTEQSGSYGPDADPLYLTVPVHLVVSPTRTQLGFWENSHRGTVTVGDELTATFEGGALRTYVCGGPVDRALVQYHALTGHSPLPPRWALGYHQCRWGYKTEADIRAVMAGFQEHDLPVSAIHFDIDYMDRYRVFTVNREAFPDLPGLIGDLAAAGITAVTILDPGVAKADDFELYREGRDAGHFLGLEDGTEVNAVVWPGLVGFPDFSDPAVRAWWSAQYPALLDQGVGGIWHDMCEPAVFSATTDASLPLATRHHLEGQGGDHVEGRNLYGQGMAQAGHAAMAEHRPDRRPWLLTRSGWAGIQRYAWTWTGDVATSWTMLHRTLCTALNLSMSGIPYTGPDVGGFSGDPSPELYTRWFQMSAWLPFFRSHSIFTMPSREPWNAAGPHLDAVREAMAWRYRLIPYLYTLAAAHATGQQPDGPVHPGESVHGQTGRGNPLILPVWWPDGMAVEDLDDQLLDVDDAFLVGPHVLVAPVFEAEAIERTVRLPAGRWYELHGDGHHDGQVTVPVTMERIPAYVRHASVLPTDESGRDVLRVYPPGGRRGRSHWYRDAGDGYGAHRLDIFFVSGDDESWTVEWRRDPRDEAFAVDDADLAVVVHGGPWAVMVDGAEPVEAAAGQALRVGAFTELVVRRPG